VTDRPYEYIDTVDAWAACARHLRAQPRVAIDLEANSLHAYREQVCLIQLSSVDQDFILDPLAGIPLDELGELVANPKIEKVFHASDYDLRLLKREYGWQVNRLFDTMWAARILGYSNMGLAWFLHEFYGVTLSKKHQKADWAKRPLTEDQLRYAQTDTRYLLQLRDDLAARLDEAGHMVEALEIFENESQVDVSERVFDPEAFWGIKGARTLKPRQQAILRALFILRDDIARQRNKPPFKLLNNDVLVSLALRAPQTPEELDGIKGLSPRALERLASPLLAAVARGKRDPVPRPPARNGTYDPAFADRYERLLQWRKTLAQRRGVESDVIMSRETLKEIARLNPRTLEELARIPSIGPHRLTMHGESLLNEMA
jgi:ribonuclease D